MSSPSMANRDHFQVTASKSSSPQRRSYTLWLSALSLGTVILTLVHNAPAVSAWVSLESRRHEAGLWGILFQKKPAYHSGTALSVARNQLKLDKSSARPLLHEGQRVPAGRLKSWLDQTKSDPRLKSRKAYLGKTSQSENSHFTSKLEMSVAGFMAQQAASRMTGQPPRPIMGVGANGFILSIDAGRGRSGSDMEVTDSEPAGSGL
uniref:Uncharacterized protein n=1 Tax=Hanusia phi TaxID=3032 RepID=A0A7S0E854_9CRYP|mmetsp:Transcript_16610/g.37931  ORF Transcript_16610/g.37931 Transcript_16610/m.37931 type:complete len:206 (+) Transcript_16610:133-750(+)